LPGEIVIPPSARSPWLRLSKYEVAAMAAWLALCLFKGQPPAPTPVLAGLTGAASARKGGNP
jgi:hypothetical protein